MEKSDSARLLLASASSRRRQLLQQIGVRFTVMPVDIDEAAHSGELPEDYVQRMAKSKAEAGRLRQVGNLPVLGADTAVVLDRRILGKPAGKQQAMDMLMTLSGRMHRVLSGVAIVAGERCEYRLSESRVTFRTLREKECLHYWRTGEPADKAGAYAIQGKGAVFVEHLQGSFSGVVGLPLAETCELLKTFAIPWWDDGAC